MRPHFKKIGNKLAFNNPGAEPIFLIVEEVEAGYLYFLETTPFGSVNFVNRDSVNFDEDEEEVTEEPSSQNESSKEPTKTTKK